MVTVAMKLNPAPWKKTVTKQDSILKSRHYFVKKFCLVKAMVFPVVMYGCESWAIRKPDNKEGLILLNCGIGEDS